MENRFQTSSAPSAMTLMTGAGICSMVSDAVYQKGYGIRELIEAYALTGGMEDLRSEKNCIVATFGMAKICRRTKQQGAISIPSTPQRPLRTGI